MAFKTFKTRREPVRLEELAARIAKREAMLGGVDVPRNTGTRRTQSKRALLNAIADIGGNW